MAWWTVKTHYKKSCEQRELFLNRHPDNDIKVTVIDGYRFCEYSVETSDDNFPEFKFVSSNGEGGKKNSIDLNNCYTGNIENTELVEMYDSGCWGETIVEGTDDTEEIERIQELVSEEGSYALEDIDEGWFLDESEVWVWGPLEVTSEDGTIERIICADVDGNVVDFKEED